MIKTEYIAFLMIFQQERKKANKLQIPHTGLLGLLLMLKNKEIISQTDCVQMFTDLRNSGFRLPNDSEMMLI